MGGDVGAAGWCPVRARASSKQVSDVQPASRWLSGCTQPTTKYGLPKPAAYRSDVQPVSQRLSGCTHQPQNMDCQSQLRAATEPASNVQPLNLTPKPRLPRTTQTARPSPCTTSMGLVTARVTVGRPRGSSAGTASSQRSRRDETSVL